jgi:HTH-type transcriptional regulator/antitoxin HigA
MKKSTANVIDNRYFELVRQFPLKTLTSDKELDQATEIINSLIDRGIDTLTNGEDAYLDVLSDMVEKYESEHHAIPDASPVEVLKMFIEDRKTNQRSVALGSGIAISTMSEILAGRRHMTLDHMQKLARFFGVDVTLFVPRQPKEAESKRIVKPVITRRAARPRKKALFS